MVSNTLPLNASSNGAKQASVPNTVLKAMHYLLLTVLFDPAATTFASRSVQKTYIVSGKVDRARRGMPNRLDHPLLHVQGTTKSKLRGSCATSAPRDRLLLPGKTSTTYLYD